MNSDSALSIIRFIDLVHQPYYWSFVMFVAFAYSFESFLPKKTVWESSFDKIISKFKLRLIHILGFIALMQGIVGGCICQIPQNYLAQNYLGKDYWYPFGLVFREFFSTEYWPILRLVYLLLGIYFYWTAFNFKQKRIVC